jgi:XTP/dITP diphosphohydrolase
MQLVFATHNENKIREIRALLPEYLELLSLNDIGCDKEIPETADTIEGNAILKVEFVNNHYGYNCFADDTGLEVNALGGAPGVFSARYAGDSKSAEANTNKLLQDLNGVEDRTARFITAIASSLNGRQNLFLGICEGSIVKTPRGSQGFGYDPIFQPAGFLKTFAEMTLAQKSEIGHRGKAMRELIDYLTGIQ